MGDVKYLRNPYVRGQLAEILQLMFPDEGAISSRFVALFENPVVVSTLLPALIRLYIDIESTGRHAQFHEKFGVRR
jgi:ubiquitin conjugation factor E4 B